jgi:hypothetical protein
MANLNKCGGYIYEGKEYTAKELFDKLNGGEIDALIAQGVVTLTQEQAPTLVKSFLKYNPINTGVKPTQEVTLETALAEYPIGSEVVVINPVTGEEKETVVSDIKEDNGFAPFVEVEDSNVPVPIANVAKKRKSRKDRDLGTIGREMLLPEDLSMEGFEFEEDDFSYHPVLEEDEDVAVTPSWIMKDENGNMYVTADSIKDNFERLYDELKKYDLGTFNIVDLRQLYVNAFQRLMKYKNGANVQLELMMELEDAIDAFNSPLDTLSKEEVIELINKNEDYTKEQKAIFVDFVNSIKSNSLFKFDPKGQASENYYAFTNNVLKAKSPNAFFHEIGHWGFYNVLSKEDRKKFYQYCIDKFYGTGVSLGESLALSKPILNEDKTMSFNYGNATDNFSEYFAEQFNQYILGKQTDKQLETIFQKLVGFVKNIIASLRKHGYDENLKELFDKIADVNNIAKPVKEVINDTIEGKPVKKVKEKKTPKLTEARKNKITTAVNSATAGVVNAASDEQLKANGWDKESLIKFQKSINDAFNNPNLGANMYGATIQVVALTSAQMYEYIKSAHPESVKGLNPEEVIIKGTLLKGNTVLLNIEKATPTTPLHEVAGHLWEKWAKLNAPLLYNSAMSKVNQMPLYELVSKADYSKGTAFEIANQLEKDPLFKKAGVSKEFLTELVQYALIKKEGGKAEINRTLRSEIFAKVIETNAEALAKGKDKTTYQFFKDLLEKLYEAIRNTLRFSSITTAELNTITVDQFSQKVIAEILSARLSTATRNKSEEELETGGKKKKQVVESLGADENEYESVQSTFGDSSMDDLTEQNEQEKKEEKALEGGLEAEAEVPVIEEEKPKSKEEKAIISSIKLDASKLFVQVVDIANDIINPFGEELSKEDKAKFKTPAEYEQFLEQKANERLNKAKADLDKLLDKIEPTMELSEREKLQDKILSTEKVIRKLESKKKLADIIRNIKNIVTDSGILKSYLEDANVPDNEKSFQAYLHKLLAGNISLTEEQRKVLGTAQRGPLSELYKYHADAVSNQEKIDEINAEIKAIVEDSKIVKKEKAVKWADVPKEVKSKFKSQAEYKKYLENKADELENRRVDLKEELTNLQAEKVTPQNIFDAVIANEKKIAKDLKIGQERSQRTSEQRFQKKLEDTSNDIFAELENIDKSIKQLNKQLKEIDENLSLEELPQSDRNKLEAAKAKLTSDKNKLVAKKNDIVNKFAQLSIGINKISPDSYKVFLESDNGQMVQLMPGAFFPNRPYLHFVTTNTDGQGTFNSTYNYKSENGANLATLTVSLNTTDGFGSVNFVAKDKLNGNTESAKEAFIAATKLIQSFGLSPKIPNYINGYGFELMEKLVTDGILVRNNLVDRIGANENKINQKYYLLQPFQYNDDAMFQLALYHGTPHDFMEFSTKFMGTGEGIQAFGWGLYFTNVKDIARSYAKDIVKKNRFKIGDETLETKDFDFLGFQTFNPTMFKFFNQPNLELSKSEVLEAAKNSYDDVISKTNEIYNTAKEYQNNLRNDIANKVIEFVKGNTKFKRDEDYIIQQFGKSLKYGFDAFLRLTYDYDTRLTVNKDIGDLIKPSGMSEKDFRLIKDILSITTYYQDVKRYNLDDVAQSIDIYNKFEDYKSIDLNQLVDLFKINENENKILALGRISDGPFISNTNEIMADIYKIYNNYITNVLNLKNIEPTIYSELIEDIENPYGNYTNLFEFLINRDTSKLNIGVEDESPKIALEQQEELYKQFVNFINNKLFVNGKENLKLTANNKKYIYSVLIHKGKTPEQYSYLRWDKKVSNENANKIVNLLLEKNIQEKSFTKYMIDENSTKEEMVGKVMMLSGQQLYDYLRNNIFSKPKDTSLFLLEAGIDGIQYPTNSLSSKPIKEDNDRFNYVVFDDRAISVEDKEALEGSEDEVQFSISLNPNANPKQQPALTPNQINAIQAIANQYQNLNQFQSPNFQPYQSQNRSWVSRMFSRFMYNFGGSKVITEDYMVAKEQKVSGYQAKMRSEMKKDRDNLISLALTADFKNEPLFKNCSTEGIIELINMALGGDMMIMNALPTELQAKAKILRNKIDAITDDILRSGYTNATTAEVMEENKGKYLTRSFYKYIMKPSRLQSLKKNIFGIPTAWDKYVENLKKSKPEVIDRALSGFFVYAIDGKIAEKSKTNDPNFKTLAQRWDMVSSNFATIDAMRKKLATITTQLETEKDSAKRKILFAEKETVSNELIAEAELQTDADVVKLVDDTKKFAEMALEDLWSQEDPSKHKVDLRGYLPGQVQNVNLIRRKEEGEFPEWMRDAIGEVQDPTINYAQTVNNLTKLDSRIKFLNQIYNLGKRDGYVIRAADVEYDAKKKEDLKKEGWVLINGTNQEDPNKLDNSPQSVYGPFIGTYIHPDLHRFAFGIEGEISGIYVLRGLVLAGKTVGNVILGPERNLAGNLGMLLMNGTFTKMATNFYYDGSINQETSYIKTLKGNNFASKYVKYWSDIVNDAERLGIISNVHSGAVVEIFKQMSKEPTLMKEFEDNAATGWTSLYKKLLTVPNEFAKFNTAAYIWADIIPKIYAFNVERNVIASEYSTFESKTGQTAQPAKMTFGSLVSMRNDAIAAKNIAEVQRLNEIIENINEIAASFTNQTMVSHERVMPLVENLNKTSFKKAPGKAFAKFVFGGDFVRFKAETTRIFLQTLSSIFGVKKQFKSKDEKGVVKLFGSKLMNDAFATKINTKQRMHSLAGFLVWSNAYAQVAALYIGFGASLLSMIGIGGGDDDEDEYIETDPSKSYKTIKQSAQGSGMFDKNANFGTELQRIYMGSVNGSMSVDEAIREFSNEYMNLHQLGFNLMGDGKFEVKDKGTIDPFASQMAVARGFVYSPQRGWTNKLNGYVSSIFSEEVGTEMLVNNTLNLLNNQDQYGKPIYNEKENIEVKAAQGAWYLIKGLSPAVLSTVLRVDKATSGIKDDKGNVIKEPVPLGKQLLQENINAFTGRSYYVDVKQKLSSFIREEAGDSDQGLNAQIYGQKSETGLKTIVYNLNRKVEAARVLGVSDNEIINIIGKSVLGRKPEIANAVYYGGSYIDNLKIEK